MACESSIRFLDAGLAPEFAQPVFPQLEIFNSKPPAKLLVTAFGQTVIAHARLRNDRPSWKLLTGSHVRPP